MVKEIYVIILCLAILLFLAPPLGRYMAAVFEGRRNILSSVAVRWNALSIASAA